jgi:hypothetical protein
MLDMLDSIQIERAIAALHRRESTTVVSQLRPRSR